MVLLHFKKNGICQNPNKYVFSRILSSLEYTLFLQKKKRNENTEFATLGPPPALGVDNSPGKPKKEIFCMAVPSTPSPSCLMAVGTSPSQQK